MNSFVLWYEGVDKTNLDLHVNIWKKREKFRIKYYIDFGFLIENINAVDRIKIYVPFQIAAAKIQDLGKVISSDQNLVNAIFNEICTTQNGNAKKMIVRRKNDTFVVYSLMASESQQSERLSCKNELGGTIINIETNSVRSQNDNYAKYYFRIRVQAPHGKLKMIDEQINGISVFSDRFTTTEIIDFRINDIRSCNENVREIFHDARKFNIKAIHYLILRDARDVIIYHGSDMTCRLLEQKVWEKYMKGINHNMIAYHFRKVSLDSDIDNYSVLTRFQYKKTIFIWLLIYIIVTIMLGVIGGWVSSLLYTC